jgi:hypothetical protein
MRIVNDDAFPVVRDGKQLDAEIALRLRQCPLFRMTAGSLHIEPLDRPVPHRDRKQRRLAR